MKKDLTGQTFGSWTVLRPTFATQRVVWVCRCECGVEKEVRTSKLENGESKSCKSCSNKKVPRGMAARKGQTHSRKKPGESGFNRLFRVYQRGARLRGYIFRLSKRQFRKLTQGNCTYCGVEPQQDMFNPSPRQTLEGLARTRYVYNGIDRVDNTEGYVPGNCVPACHSCNTAKGSLTLTDFLRRKSRKEKSH